MLTARRAEMTKAVRVHLIAGRDLRPVDHPAARDRPPAGLPADRLPAVRLKLATRASTVSKRSVTRDARAVRLTSNV